MQKVKADIIIIGVIVLSAALLFFVPKWIHAGEKEGTVQILQDGKLLYEYSLYKEQTISVAFGEQGYNLVMIGNGSVQVTDADCPDKLCVKQRHISKNGESIICLPHKLVVQIVSKEESGPDAVTN